MLTLQRPKIPGRIAAANPHALTAWPRTMLERMRFVAGFFLVVLMACKGDPVEWGDPVFPGPPEPVDFVRPPNIADASACPVSFRIASNGNFRYAVWWRIDPDSSALLMVARSTNGSDWSTPVVADSTDHSTRGCGRPAPAIAADSVTGYVHLAYFIETSSGSGVFFAHSMDTASTFHSPVPIVFGPNPSRVSVASEGDRVAVAYEDPNAQQPLVGIALSKTMGHIFENRMQATPDNARAMQPIVRVGRDSIRLWWSRYSDDPAISATRPAYRAAEWK